MQDLKIFVKLVNEAVLCCQLSQDCRGAETSSLKNVSVSLGLNTF